MKIVGAVGGETAWQKHNRQLREARARARAAFADVDFEAFIAQVKALPVFARCPRSIKKTEVRLVYTTCRQSGRAHGNRFVRICFGPTTGHAWVLETIVHELVHSALPERTGHNERFRLTLARAVQELWGIDLDPSPKDEQGRRQIYLQDANITEVLRGALAMGWVTYPKKVAVAPIDPAALEAARKARLAGLVERRRQHALKMFARAEKRALAAAKTRAKWLAKVRYYERVAAKRG